MICNLTLNFLNLIKLLDKLALLAAPLTMKKNEFLVTPSSRARGLRSSCVPAPTGDGFRVYRNQAPCMRLRDWLLGPMLEPGSRDAKRLWQPGSAGKPFLRSLSRAGTARAQARGKICRTHAHPLSLATVITLISYASGLANCSLASNREMNQSTQIRK